MPKLTPWQVVQNLKRFRNFYRQIKSAYSAVKKVNSKRNFSSNFSPTNPLNPKNKINTKNDGNEKIIRMKGMTMTTKSIYMDMQATTPMDPRVLDAMMPYLTEKFGNPHSRNHIYGWEAEEAVENARKQIAKLINAEPREIIFTSGATESNNLAIKGMAEFYKSKRKHIIALQTEHKCVLDSCRFLENRGFELTYLPVKKNGEVDLDLLKKEIRPNETSIVCAMYVNNEIGVIQPVEEIGKICKENNVLFHCDAAQAVGKIPVDVRSLNAATLSISGHKMYGPMGIGAIYIRKRPRVRLVPLFSGGGQERGLRSGTLSPPLCVGLGEACKIAASEIPTEFKRIERLSKKLLDGINSKVSHVVLNGEGANRYAGNLNLSFSCVEGESLMMGMNRIAVSSGSACTSESLEPSYVLRAIGVSDDMAHTSIRYGLGRFTTEKEVEMAIKETVEHVKKLRELSPLWEMVQKGTDLSKIQWTN